MTQETSTDTCIVTCTVQYMYFHCLVSWRSCVATALLSKGANGSLWMLITGLRETELQQVNKLLRESGKVYK